MRETTERGLTMLRQKAPDPCGKTLSERNFAPMAFNLNQNSALCLPLVTDSKKLIWVHSNQDDLQLDGAAELDKAFDRFPYLTQNQTAALAQRCSLHPDQVKVWFMVQRLRYGISWDYEDILKVQRKFNSSWGKEKLQNHRGKNNKWEKKMEESGGKKVQVVRERHANEGRMTGGNVRANERSERKMKQKQPMKEKKHRKVELEEDKRNAQKKRKRMTVTDKMRKKRRVDEGVVASAEVEITGGKVERESITFKPTQLETTLFTRKKKKTKKRLVSVQERSAHKTPNICVKEMEVKLEEEPCAESTNLSDTITELTDNSVAADGTGIHSTKKNSSQLEMMKAAFVRCQYPDRECYDKLARLISIPRYMLVQWFGDMRYYIKKGKPRWMTQEQHREALANIKYQQYLNSLAKAQLSEGNLEDEAGHE